MLLYPFTTTLSPVLGHHPLLVYIDNVYIHIFYIKNTNKRRNACMERRETERWRVLALEVKCASCCDDQTPFLRPNSFPVTLRMKNNSTELPGFLQILITIDKIFSDQDRIDPEYQELGWDERTFVSITETSSPWQYIYQPHIFLSAPPSSSDNLQDPV